MNRPLAGYLLTETLLALVLGGVIALALARILIWAHRSAPRLDNPAALVRSDATRTFACFRNLLARTQHTTLVNAALPDSTALFAARWLRDHPLPADPAHAQAALLQAGFTFREEPGWTLFLQAPSGRPLGVLTIATETRTDGTWQVVRLAPADDPPRGFHWRHPVGPLLWRIHEAAAPHAMASAEFDLPDPTHPRSRTRYVLPLHP